MKTNYAGIDYGLGKSNVNVTTGIRFGVIHQNNVGQSWFDASQPYYGKPDEIECPHCDQTVRVNVDKESPIDWGDCVDCPNCGNGIECELPDCAEPISHYVDDKDIAAECGEMGDIFVQRSPYFTYAQFCSPCAPGACYLLNWIGNSEGQAGVTKEYLESLSNNRAYCLGHDWFDDGKAPYPVYSVATGELVNP